MTDVVRAVVSAVTRAATSAPAPTPPGPTERIQNGDFSSSAHWVVPADWSISGGVATGTNGALALKNTLSSPIDNLADISAFRFDLANGEPCEVAVFLVRSSDGKTYTVYDGTDDGIAIAPTSTVAGATGPYDELWIFNVDGIAQIIVDNVTLVV